MLEGKQQYFWHGPMVRAELGEQQVQGLDYTYTLQGWLKAINSTFGTPYADGNQDGFNVMSFAQDAFGFELGYYNGDYKPVSNRPYNVIATQTGSSLQSLQTSLYNGNISYSVTSLPDSLKYTNLQLDQQPKASLYKYDQLNRLTKSLTLHLDADDISNNLWKSGFSTVPEFSVTNISYDANGNIMALNRNAEAANTNMDALSYNYDGNTNKLLWVDDAVGAANHGEDIDDQAANNYAYDAIGNLIQDNAEEIASIEWTVYGKVKSITRTALSQRPDLEFTYNAIGQRLSKKVIPKNGDKPTTTYYIYNAGGNCMATYKHTDINTSGIYYTETFTAEEYTIYGASRLGVETVSIQLYEHTYSEMQGGGISTITEDYFTPTPQATYTIQLGNKNYELSNHLGNVLVTITDRKIAINSGGSIDYHLPDIASVTDYYPYGMRIETRSWNITKYRFGYQGQESDNEIGGSGNYLSYKYRFYDSRLGRFLSLDPIRYEYPHYSPYHFSSNQPIHSKELEGLESANDLDVNDPNVHLFLKWSREEGKGGTLLNNKYYNIYDKARSETISIGVTILLTLYASPVVALRMGAAGGLFSGGYELFFGEGTTKSVLKKSLSGFVGGMILSRGPSNINSMTSLLGVGGIGGVSGIFSEAFEQSFEQIFEDGKGFNSEKLLINGVIGVLGNMIGTAGSQNIMSKVDEIVENMIAKTYTQDYINGVKAIIKEGNKKISKRQLRKLTSEKLRNVRDSISAQGEQLKTVFLEMTNTAIDALSEYVERTTTEDISNTE